MLNLGLPDVKTEQKPEIRNIIQPLQLGTCNPQYIKCLVLGLCYTFDLGWLYAVPSAFAKVQPTHSFHVS